MIDGGLVEGGNEWEGAWGLAYGSGVLRAALAQWSLLLRRVRDEGEVVMGAAELRAARWMEAMMSERLGASMTRKQRRKSSFKTWEIGMAR